MREEEERGRVTLEKEREMEGERKKGGSDEGAEEEEEEERINIVKRKMRDIKWRRRRRTKRSRGVLKRIGWKLKFKNSFFFFSFVFSIKINKLLLRPSNMKYK